MKQFVCVQDGVAARCETGILVWSDEIAALQWCNVNGETWHVEPLVKATLLNVPLPL